MHMKEKELEQLIAYAERQLKAAQEANDELNIFFYSKTLEAYQGEEGPFYGSLLKALNGDCERFYRLLRKALKD